METTLDPILSMLAVADRLATTNAPEATRLLAQVQVARDRTERIELVQRTLQVQGEIEQALKQLLERLEEWNDYQDVIQVTRALRDRQRDLQTRTEEVKGKMTHGSTMLGLPVSRQAVAWRARARSFAAVALFALVGCIFVSAAPAQTDPETIVKLRRDQDDILNKAEHPQALMQRLLARYERERKAEHVSCCRRSRAHRAFRASCATWRRSATTHGRGLHRGAAQAEGGRRRPRAGC
jgi:TolA-binding protein